MESEGTDERNMRERNIRPVVRRPEQVQASDCSAPARRPGFGVELIVLSLPFLERGLPIEDWRAPAEILGRSRHGAERMHQVADAIDK